MTRPRRTDAELQAASRHLLYERAMLVATAEKIATIDPAHDVERLALLESFLVHARALLHCFYPDGRIYDDDVLASDFFDDAQEWSRLRPALAPELVAVRGDVNTHLAHLSYRRAASRVDWEFAAITAALQRVGAMFSRNAPRSRLSPEWP